MLHRRVASFVLATCLSIVANAATVGVVVGPSSTFTFSPKEITISLGDTVTWTLSSGVHNVHSETNAFNSDPILTTPYSFTFQTAGTFPYYCTFHGGPAGFGMSGTVIVKLPTTTALGDSAATTTYGEAATLTATVSANPPASGMPTGTVTFNDGTGTLCAVVTLNGAGTATCSTAPLGAGPHTITATYNGDATLNTSASAPVSHTVNQASTTTALSSAPNPSGGNQNANFTATISIVSPGAGSISGTVTFFEGAVEICSGVPVSGASAVCTTRSLPPGQHTIHAVYSGDSNLTGSTSLDVVQTVLVPPAVPAGLDAHATSATDVALSWDAVADASFYEVWRRPNINNAADFVVSTPDTTATDSILLPNTTYLYQVRAIGTTGTSAFGPFDPATTVIFTHGNLDGALVEGIDMSEVRTAVNAMHVAANLGPATFTDDPSAVGTLIKAAHIIELRTQLDDARLQIGVPALIYAQTITAGTTLIKFGDFTELRAGTQ